MSNTEENNARELRLAFEGAEEYILKTKNWRRSEFRMESKGLTQDEKNFVIWGVFLEDELFPRPGGGKSIELHVDRSSFRVVSELAFQ